MKHPFRKRLHLLALLLLVLIVASGCVSARMGVSWPSVSLIGDTPYIMLAYNDYVVQIDPSDGTEVMLRDANGQVRVDPTTGEARTWDVSSGAMQSFYGAPVLLEDGVTLLAAEFNNKFVEIDNPTARIENPAGRPIDGHPIADMLIHGDRIYLGYNSKNLEAFDLNTMNVLWTFETESGVWSKPLVIDDVLYFTSMDHYLYAVDTAAGELLWKTDLGGAAASTPAHVGDSLYIGTFARTVVEVSLAGGEITATYETGNWVWGTPAVDGDTLYVADLSGFVYALSAPGLTEKWAVVGAPTGIRPAPVVVEDSVIVVSRTGKLVWLDKNNGSELQSREIQDEVLSDLLIVPAGTGLREPLVVITGIHNNPMLAAFTVRSGQRVWDYKR